jgi:SpoVK/Ycf46/Vps4 family AAA+-type ATPase
VTRNSVVAQLSTIMDEYNSLNNILIFGMRSNIFHRKRLIFSNLGTTNRLDMIDLALLRAGRFELQIKMGKFSLILPA